MTTRETKTCRVCGRTMTWRKRWERAWDEVTTCSEGCRKKRRELSGQGLELEAQILELARERHPRSLCPSEVARRQAPDAWRELMEPTREAARRLVAKGLVAITQGGREVEPSTARGAIRIVLVSPRSA